MLQFPAMMRQFPATPLLPTTTLLPVVAVPQEEEMLLSMAESELEEKLNDIRKANSNLVIIGKAGTDSYKEDMEADGEDEEGEHVDESDAEDFEQETGP
ncbi:transcription termination factor [Carex rostrata]